MRRSVDPVIYCTASAMVHGLSLDAIGGIQSRSAQAHSKRMMYVAESINAKELSRARQGSRHSALLCRPIYKLVYKLPHHTEGRTCSAKG